ncbi:MAG TPA: SLC13 family permease [Stellaceae bacterium]|nr:SLC13 family permease [Stellaceae bacterium]
MQDANIANAVTVLVFLLTYLGMAAGRLPWLQVDRTGIALLGVIALLGTGAATTDDITNDIDTATLFLLFALMIISAQFASSGFLDVCVQRLMSVRGGPAALLALTVAVCGGLSAILANDILLIGLTPLLIAGVRRRGLDPRPFVLALAAATNAGSAATLIGNPQNIAIGQMGNLNFWSFLGACGIPALVGLGVVFGVIWFLWRGRMENVEALPPDLPEVPFHPHDRLQTVKGAVAVALLLLSFTTSLQREVAALLLAALLLASRKVTSRTMIAAVDWPLLLLFACLFAVTGALHDTGIPWTFISSLQGEGLMPDNLTVLTPLTLLMSNTIGNVPSVILLLQIWPDAPQGALYALALLSTLAGNLLLVGSFANLIVVDRAAAYGVRITFAEHARAGVPITLLSMAFALAWLAFWDWLPFLPGAD